MSDTFDIRGLCLSRTYYPSLLLQVLKGPTHGIGLYKAIYMDNTPVHNTVLNNYNAHSMSIEIARGLSDSPALGLIELGEDQWYDPQTNFTKLLPLEVASKLRRDLDVLARHVARSDLDRKSTRLNSSH